jgi:hypothetical protein
MIIRGAEKGTGVWVLLQVVKTDPEETVTDPAAMLQIVGMVRDQNWEEYNPRIGIWQGERVDG